MRRRRPRRSSAGTRTEDDDDAAALAACVPVDFSEEPSGSPGGGNGAPAVDDFSEELLGRSAPTRRGRITPRAKPAASRPAPRRDDVPPSIVFYPPIPSRDPPPENLLEQF
mmetsp:Transcript_24079/g.57081  ORF Transcript_24079/g.57081 Transcript_24079/m.57081 type:complete len:111 (+) Transcript_24079:174-506(+)